MFMQLDMDLLIAIRTAPNHSWINPAERCMSIINLALQHVALSRKEMDKKFEDKIKNKSSLNAVRNLATSCLGLKEAFSESISEVLETVNARFGRMKLKEVPFIVYPGVPGSEIDDHLDNVREFTHADPTKVNPAASSKDLSESGQLLDFLRRHSISCHYSFQIGKCFDDHCPCCRFQPPRLLEPIPFHPCPVPLHGKDVDDSHRPSAKNTSAFCDAAVEADRRNRDVLKAGKARDTLHCNDCGRPRGVYLRQIREEGDFVCSESLSEESGLVTRQSINCTSELEITYYSAPLRAIAPPCCVYCGAQEGFLDEYIERLLAEFPVVRPLCLSCRYKGLDAKTWGESCSRSQRHQPIRMCMFKL
ncbi:uncharacterized protein LOC132544583 [Ylistrum balloti]|uniref:uncharacterized protein LOC132544583 n=1 Tax=Ylistrum balloti TaxID=509963 RepID=UPI0029058A3E|nr:uncharacterized protein LOC132544583 [Ylistrum balloti]